MPKFGDIKGGLKGLTASDRSDSDRIAISQQAGEPDYLVSSPTSTGLSTSRQYFQGVHDTNAIIQNTYQDMLQQYREKYNEDPRTASSTIQDVAYKVSPYYKKFMGSDYIDLTSNDWAHLAAQYEAMRSTQGEEAANNMLNSQIKDNVAKNQPWYEQAWYGFLGLGSSAAGALISTVGAVKGAIDYFSGNYEDKDYMSGWENFMNSVIDNNWTRYGNDIVQYGTLRTDKMKEAKELGISELQIVESADQEDSLVSTATPWVALQSGGFTLASMMTGWGEAKLAGMLFKGLGTAAKTIQTGEKLAKTLTGLQRAENFTNAFIIPGMVGTTEGLVEGLNTKQQVEQKGLEMVTNMHREQVANEVNRRLGEYKKVVDNSGETPVTKYFDSKGNEVDVDGLYQQVWQEFEPKYKQSLDQVDYAATRAGINNFYVNSAINGLVNSTLKAGLQAAPVRKALQNSRLFGWAQPMFRGFNITGSGASTTVTPRFSKWTTAWNIAKEPLGEFTEEYLQSVSDATMSGGAENNIHNFIENKYLGDGTAAVGDSFSSDYSAAWTAFTGSLVDKESIKSGILGAISSAMGTPSLGHRARTGRLNADGTAETTYFGRGLNELGEQESNLERLGRILPWRSGLTSAYRQSRLDRHHATEAAEALQEWLGDPNNKGKFDGLTGTFNWALSMGSSARGNDEFGYRNSALGKTINDAFMLQMLEGTSYYDAYMNQLSSIANLEEGTDIANSAIQSMKDDVNIDTESMSDEDILKTLKKNANLMLTTIDKIQQESDLIDRLLGNVDSDTKQTLIYGQLMLEDWRERQKKLREELGTLNIENSREHSTSLTTKQKELIARYGSIAEAQERLQNLEKSTASIQEDINNIRSRKNITDTEKKILKEKTVKLKTMQKEMKNLENVKDFEGDVNVVLNEEEIMSLDPVSRTTMLINGKQRTYLATHDDREYAEKKAALTEQLDKLQLEREKVLRSRNGAKKRRASQLQQEIDKVQKELDNLTADERYYFSDEQQSVIDNLIAKGIAQDRNFLDKVVDMGRMENSINTFYKQYNAILSDKDSFNNFVYAARQSAADIATKRRFQALNDTQDYSSFARELDRVFNEGTTREQAILTRKFKRNNNANFERYVNERNMIQGLIEHVVESEKFKDLSDNDADMFAHTLTYLSNKGIDLNNESDIINALSEVDENGVLEFKKYVEEANQSLDEVDRTAFTSIGEAIQTFKDVMDSYRGQQAEIAANATPIIPTSTTAEQSAPIQSPDPVTPDNAAPTEPSTAPGGSIFDMAATTADGSFLRPDGTPIGDVEIETPSQPSTPKNPIIEAFKDNSNEEVAKAAEVALNVINNTPRFSDEARGVAKSFVELLSNNSFDTVDEFVDAINASANAREAQSEEGTDEAANLLRQASAKAKANSVSEVQAPTAPTTQERRGSSLLERTRGKLREQNQIINSMYDMFPNATYTSSFIASINIDYIRQKHPNSPTVNYYDKYHIEDAIRDGVLEGNPDIMFITDAELENAYKEYYPSYDGNTDIPIVAVVKSSNGPLIIDGVSYQPVSIMAATKEPTEGLTDEERKKQEWSAGAAHMKPIRILAQANKGETKIIKNTNGTPIVTKLYGTPKAYSADNGLRGRNNIIDIGINDLNDSDRTQVQAASKSARRNLPAYQRAKRRFLDKLIVRDNGSRKILSFEQTRLNGNVGYIDIFTSPINETTARNSDSTFADVVGSNNPTDIINFNSRTSRAAKALSNFINSFTTDGMIFDLDANGQIVPTDVTKGVLSGLASSLDKSISNFINVPISQGWTYSISPTMDVVGENRVMSINLVNTNSKETIALTTIHAGMTEEEIQAAQAEFLKNLIMDGNTVRMVNAKDSFAKWNVPYSDVTKMADNKKAADNISDIYDDGILGAPATSFNYRIQGIAVQNPFKGDGTPIFNQVANQDNAQPATPVDKPVVAANNQVESNGAIVDSDTGTILDGTPAPITNQAQQNAAKIVDKIIEDSKNIRLSEDETAYVDSKTGTRYARVTSIIAADEYSEGRFDPNSPWGTPSTNIGTGFDEFTRDFFAGVVEGRMDELEKYYPNATKEQLTRFAEQLKTLRNSFIANGLTVVPRDVTVTGSLDVADTNGNIHTVSVAGTLDLLAYDVRGNFYIFDMKTNRGGIDEHKKQKYARQLSMYKKFLESKYGVKVNSMQLIPIHVEYPTPVGAKSGGKMGTANYSVSPEKKNQLLIDGRDFKNANPSLESLIPVNYQEPSIVWDKLTDDERKMFGGIEEELEAQAETPVTPAEAVVTDDDNTGSFDPILGTSFSDDYLGNMFGDDSIVSEGFSTDMNERTTPIPEHLKWNNLTETQRENLEMMGFDETSWSSMEDEEMEHKLKCME